MSYSISISGHIGDSDSSEVQTQKKEEILAMSRRYAKDMPGVQTAHYSDADGDVDLLTLDDEDVKA